MATIFDLIEVTSISENTTYSTANGNLLGVVESMSSADLNDGEFDEGDDVIIDGVSYNIDEIEEPSSTGRFTLADGSDLSFNPGSESNLSVVFLTMSNGGDVRCFIIPNDSYGDMNIEEIRTGSINGASGSDATTISTGDNNINVVCFVTGTLIKTPSGDVPIEDIQVGTTVLTRDHGAQTVRALLVRELDLRQAPERLKPVAFQAGSLGRGLPSRQLCVSQQHRMLVNDPSGQSVLVPAKALVDRPGVRVMLGKRQVIYWHLIFSRHEIIHANKTPTESFFPGPMALNCLDASCKAEIHEILDKVPSTHADVADMAAAPSWPFQIAKQRALMFN